MGSVIKRSRQFFRALFCRPDSEDRAFIGEYLNPVEKSLFDSMDLPIQKHCVNVARTVHQICRGQDVNRRMLVTAALLHDIGKTRSSFSLIHRVLFVLFRKFAPELTRQIGLLNDNRPFGSRCFRRVRHAFYVHLNHERLGAELARQAELTQDIVFLIQNHHNLSMAADSKELAILYKADEMN